MVATSKVTVPLVNGLGRRDQACSGPIHDLAFVIAIFRELYDIRVCWDPVPRYYDDRALRRPNSTTYTACYLICAILTGCNMGYLA